MSYACWEDYGRPACDTPEVRRAAKLIEDADDCGALHLLVADWNATKGDIAFCRHDNPTADEVVLLDLLKSMPHQHRIAALALAEGYWKPKE